MDAKEEQRFREAVPKSWEAVWAVARHMQRNGLAVQVPPLTMRDDMRDRAGFGDNFDLSVMQNFEVKWRNLSFTSAADYPYTTIFIDRVEKVDRAGSQVSAYICVNAGLTHALRVPRSTKPRWTTSSRHDSTKGYGFNVYEAPLDCAAFFPLKAATD